MDHSKVLARQVDSPDIFWRHLENPSAHIYHRLSVGSSGTPGLWHILPDRITVGITHWFFQLLT
jgi:hypothetical protein